MNIWIIYTRDIDIYNKHTYIYEISIQERSIKSIYVYNDKNKHGLPWFFSS